MKDSGHTHIYILQRLTLENKNKQKPKMRVVGKGMKGRLKVTQGQ